MDSVSAEEPIDVAGDDAPPGDVESRSGSPWLILLSVGSVIIVIDQLTKIWAVAALDDREPIDIFWTLRLNLVRNDGAAFSIGTGLTPFIAILAICVSAALLVAARNVRRPPVLVAMGLILGGALGNVVDRIFRDGDGFLRGPVVDFVDLQWWPVFNVADMAIVIGGFLLVVLLADDGGERAS